MTAPEPMPAVLHQDDPARTTTGPDGRPIRNLTAEEYAATYAEGTGGHALPDGMLETALADIREDEK